MLRLVVIALSLFVGAPAALANKGKARAKKPLTSEVINGSRLVWNLPFQVNTQPDMKQKAKQLQKKWSADPDLQWRRYVNAKKPLQQLLAAEKKVDAATHKNLLAKSPAFLGEKVLFSKVGKRKGFRLDVTKVGKGYVSWITHAGGNGYANYLAVAHPNLKNARVGGMKLGRAADSGNPSAMANAKPRQEPKAKTAATSVAPPSPANEAGNTPMFFAIGCAVFALLLVGGAAMFTNPSPGKETASAPGVPEHELAERVDDLLVA